MTRSFSKSLLSASILTAGILSASPALAQSCQSPTPIWADEFDGNSLDTSRWEPQTGDGCDQSLCGWGNQELQFYKAENATVSNGKLKITAKRERNRGSRYTSARLRTANMTNGGQWKNGRFEARIKIPDGGGMWPAFWMLPTDPNVGWPESGEIDIMESTGHHPESVFGTIHYGDPYPNNQFSGNSIRKMPDTWADDFHVYALEWTPNEMRWYVDDILYSTKTPADMSDPAFWTFENYQYHFILNLAVGGTLGGEVDNGALPQVMEVDYVRVYDFGQPALSGPNIVPPNASAEYSVVSEIGSNSSYSWTAPTGETGSASNFTVNWSDTGGSVTTSVSNSCGTHDLSMDVHVLPVVVKESVLDDHEGNGSLTYTSVDGALTSPVSNPAPDSVNDSGSVGEYIRNASAQYDVLAGNTSAVPDASVFLNGTKVFYLDVYTAAPVGTEILVQLEDNSVATSSNYPNGRHSKYAAYTTAENAWQRLRFDLQERIDGATSDTAVTSVLLLIDPNSNNGDTYYLDNFDIYGPDDGGNNGGGDPVSISIASVETGTQGAGKGSKYGTATVTVTDNLGNPVDGANISGSFSGTWSDSVSGTTGSNGAVTFVTQSTAGGKVNVNFCVSSLSGSLPHDETGSTGLCP